MKKIAILGSTGSIGTQALDIIRNNADKYQVAVVSGLSNMALLSEQILCFEPEAAVVPNEAAALQLQKKHPKTAFLIGKQGLVDAVRDIRSDLVLNALVGMIGLEPTYEAIKSGRDIALANKETLVAGGALIMTAVAEKAVKLIPVDSEHSALFQCLEGNRQNTVKRLILTASGGPFRGKTIEDLEKVTVADALNHPNWTMGKKITIDSATLMNKGLEIIEAHWLFNIPANKIEVLVHPESIIHSMVEFTDHAILAQLGAPDMRGPINFAFSYPKRLENKLEALDFAQIKQLTFEKPDRKTFHCLQAAYDALDHGDSHMIALNAANEVLVGLFLNHKITFLAIQNTIKKIMEAHISTPALTMEAILSIDEETREKVKELCL